MRVHTPKGRNAGLQGVGVSYVAPFRGLINKMFANSTYLKNMTTGSVTVDNPNYESSQIRSLNKVGVADSSWQGPANSNKSYAGELQFKMHANAAGHCMLLTARDDGVRFGGWNLQVVGGNLSLQIGDGTRWLGVKAGAIQTNAWHHVAWRLSNGDKTAEVHLDGVKYDKVHSGNSQWDQMPNPYRHATSSLVIGALTMSHPKFRFAGEIKGIKLGADLVAAAATADDLSGEFADFADTQLDIDDMDVATYVNMMDQYVQDRDWIKQALARLKKELAEEMSLNGMLKQLSADNANFLFRKVEEFMTTYKEEIAETETELSSVFNELTRVIAENREYMNNNKAGRDRLVELDVAGVHTQVQNIRRLIDSNVDLLKDNHRWGDTQDKAWKFV